MILMASQFMCRTRRQMLLLAGLILILHAGSVAGSEGPLKFAGVAFSPGSTVKANAPLSTQEKSLAAQGGNVAPPNAVAVLATPVNFDPRKSWPVLIACSTSDFKRQNRDDLVSFTARPASVKVGCCLRATDRSLRETIPPRGAEQ